MDPTTEPLKFWINSTSLRISNADASLQFYKFLGMKVLLCKSMKSPVNATPCTKYFLGYESSFSHDKTLSSIEALSKEQGLLQLTLYDVQSDDEKPRPEQSATDWKPGFGHICISVDNIQAACKRLEDNNIPFQKKLTQGRMNHIAFILDPDGYWVELIGQKSLEESEHLSTTNLTDYRLNHTMIRVRDPQKSLHFYQNILYMKLLRIKESEASKFNLYFIYAQQTSSTPPSGDSSFIQSKLSGILELTWNYGTERIHDFTYHTNTNIPYGYEGIWLAVNTNLERALDHFKANNVQILRQNLQTSPKFVVIQGKSTQSLPNR